MRRQVAIWSAVFALASLAPYSTFAAAAPGSKQSDGSTMTSTAPAAVDGSDLQAAAEAAGALGAYIDRDTGEFVIVRESGTALDLARAPLAPGGRLRIEDRSISRATIDSLLDVLASMHLDPTIAGHSYSAWFDLPTGKVVLSSDLPAEAFKEAWDRFGEYISYVHRRSDATELSRQHDIPAYWGGVRISTEAIWDDSPCSAGFTVRKTSDNKNYMVSASHCAETLEQVIRQPLGNIEGRVKFTTNRFVDFTDLLLIGNETYAGQVYTTSNASAEFPAQSVSHAGNPVVGFSNYCLSGAKTFYHCGHTAVAAGVMKCFADGHCLKNLVTMTGGTFPILGDSGGPVFATQNGKAQIRGVVIAGAGDQSAFYIHNFSTVSNTFGAVIVLGP